MRTIFIILLSVSATLIVVSFVRDLTTPPPLLLRCEAIDLEGLVTQKDFLPMINDKNIIVCPECQVKVFEIKDLMKHARELKEKMDEDSHAKYF